MQIKELRILPPVAIGRLGSSTEPVAAYDLVVKDHKPVGFREIHPMETFTIDKQSHQITSHFPKEIIFKDAPSTKSKHGTIRPVAPFLELFAITDEQPDRLVPVTPDLLAKAGLSADNIQWTVKVGNLKIYRRTGHAHDKIEAEVTVNDYTEHPLLGQCHNFLTGRSLPLGKVQAIAPSAAFPGLRLRFTPAQGKVYGSSLQRIEKEGKEPKDDPTFHNDESLILYNTDTGKWHGYAEKSSFNATYTMPAQIFAGYDKKNGDHVSWGYLDDECDGIVTAILDTGNGKLVSRAHICAGPPAFAPDILPIRAVSDELEQILLGTDIEGEVPIEEAEEIVRRAFESITLMNTAVMNGNPINGRENVASTMVRQDTNDLGRLFEPIMAGSIVDNLALRTLHERVFNGLSTGAAAWFADALRMPSKIGDLSDTERRKMPGMMRGADGRALTLTYRMINTVIRAAASAMFRNNEAIKENWTGLGDPLQANNLAAQLHYRGAGNPYSVIPRAAISNCFPGLEFDFRNLWRRTFKEIILSENDNYVLADASPVNTGQASLAGRRLVAVNGSPTMVQGEGPVFPGGDNVTLGTSENPTGAVFMEWSNLIAGMKLQPGDTVQAQFTSGSAPLPVMVTTKELVDKEKYPVFTLTVNEFFRPGTSELTKEIIQPGELTHGLCAPWQNDYRECACYYWAASRPDYVNVQPAENGLSKGDMWLSKRRSGEYVPDNRVDTRLVSYDDLFRNWEGELNFIINGHDALASNPVSEIKPAGTQEGNGKGNGKEHGENALKDLKKTASQTSNRG